MSQFALEIAQVALAALLREPLSPNHPHHTVVRHYKLLVACAVSCSKYKGTARIALAPTMDAISQLVRRPTMGVQERLLIVALRQWRAAQC